MMRVFLGNPPWSKPGFYGVRAGSRWPHMEASCSQYRPFPFFLAYSAGLLEKHGYFPRIVDAIAENISEVAFLHKIEKYSPHLIVLEVSTPSFSDDLKLVHAIRQRLGSQPRVALCGPNHLMVGSSFLETHPEIDYVFRGEYEFILLELVQTLEQGKQPDHILGLNYRTTDGKVVVNPERPLLKNIDELPWPSRHQLPMMAYYDEAGGIPQPSAQVWASRGCPFQCIFCVWPQLVYGGANYRVRDPIDVVNEMEWLVRTYQYKSIYFDDDTFNIGKPRMLKLCQEIESRKLGIPWAIMARADTMDREILEAMARANLFSVKYGVESADQIIVDNSGKKLDLSRVRETVAITKELGIQLHLTFTFGLPGETLETARRTIDFALELDPNTVQFSICTPMPGSRYFDMLEHKGYLCSTDWSSYTGFDSAVIRTDALSPDDLTAILEEANSAWNTHIGNKITMKQKVAHSIRKTGKKLLHFLKLEQ